MYVFDMRHAPDPPPYGSIPYVPAVIDPITFNPWPFTPAVMRCPSEEQPGEGHSYFLNSYPVDRFAKAGNLRQAGLSSSELIIAGEKYGET
jgi:hypothetical protein